MKAKVLKEYLKDIPDSYSFELGKCFVVPGEKADLDPNDFYEIIFDSPIIGMAVDKKSKHFRIILDSKDLDKGIKTLGKLRKFKRRLVRELILSWQKRCQLWLQSL